MMAPIVDEFRELVRGTVRGPLKVPMISTLTGRWVVDGQLSDPDYWASHLRQTVRFADAAARLLDQPDMIVLEVGPGQTLTSLVRQHPDAAPDRAVLASLRHPRQQISDEESIFRALGQGVGGGRDRRLGRGARWPQAPSAASDLPVRSRAVLDRPHGPARWRARDRTTPAGRDAGRGSGRRARDAASGPGRRRCRRSGDRHAQGPHRRAPGLDPRRPERGRRIGARSDGDASPSWGSTRCSSPRPMRSSGSSSACGSRFASYSRRLPPLLHLPVSSTPGSRRMPFRSRIAGR